jgi:Zn-dependent peptidase ImmA (M78 family)
MIPKSVKIGAQVFDILERTKKQDSLLAEGNYGYTRDEVNLIVVDSELPLSKKKVTLLHEILHAARMVFELSVKPADKSSFDDWEHYFISIYEQSLLMVLQENPEIVKWLIKN